MKAGIFITLEGLDGAGKSTHLNAVTEFWRARGRDVVTTREPGGTPFGEQLRALLLDPAQKIHSETEVLLMFAARREHLAQVIVPALARGAVVISDRFTDATFAYQGSGRGIDWERLKVLEQWVQGDLQPHLTLLFDVAPEIARGRAANARAADRFEQEQMDFFTRVRAGYLRRAEEAPHRIRIVNAGMSQEEVQQKVLAFMELLAESS